MSKMRTNAFEINSNNSVSIITPLFNSGKFFMEAYNSVISQTYPNWEWIIVDDCSSDDSFAIASKFAQNDSRIKLFKLDKNQGAAVARNYAISHANGRYIAFLDSDDLWKPEKLERQIAFMEENDCPFTYSYYEEIDEFGNETDKIIRPPLTLTYKKLLKTNYVGCLTAMYDTIKLGKVFMPLIRKRQDYGLWLRLLKKTSYAKCVPESLAYYRVRKDSMSSNKIELIRYHWHLFHDIEELSVLRSLYYISWNIFIKLFNLK
ncbi:putative teichuronic acid biosynthesis glycosyltransferase TuaG [bioreactor metagenome]|uniref:Putative teichuronic acid biosynthesis glycosyltransferase TuaG n=1 Tax=bioreactor metagenome TaxID=1076179 RepID=A0A644XD84_9ZZZZ